MLLYQLIANYEKHTHGYFFSPDTLKFFGEKLSEMYILKNTVNILDCEGENHTCYVLSSRQHNHPAGPTRVYHYFDTVTFEQVIGD